MRSDDTIAAIASAPGAAEIGIIRLTGPDAVTLYQRFVDEEPIKTSGYHHSEISLARFGAAGCLPVSAYVWPNQRSYTGQPSVELRTFGSAPLLELLLEEFFRLGARPAQRGEFTLRAFLAGRLDLAQADAVLGVIEAADFQQLSVALKQLAGGLSGLITAARSELLNLLADLEAGLDFVDEDIEFIESQELIRRLTTVRDDMNSLHQQAEHRMQSQPRQRVALGGLPNAGKSTLFNALLGRDAALVSEISGTTRDYLAAALNWDGLDLELIDTAGWMSTDAAIEHAAQAQRKDQFEQADVIVWCESSALNVAHKQLNQQYFNAINRENQNRLRVLRTQTKKDLESSSCDDPTVFDCRISARTGEGLAELRSLVVSTLRHAAGNATELIGSTAARSRESLRASVESLDRATQSALGRLGDELVAIEIREALEQLGQIVGVVYTDDILDRIFSRFCIGK